MSAYTILAEDYENLTSVVVEQEGYASDGWDIIIQGEVMDNEVDLFELELFHEGCGRYHLRSCVIG